MRQSNPIAILNHAYLTEYNFVKFMLTNVICNFKLLFVKVFAAPVYYFISLHTFHMRVVSS